MKTNALIIDDSITVRMDLKECIEASGFAATLCATLASARDCLARDSFDIILLDLLLPDGDGLEFLKEVKSTPALNKVPVILLSSESEIHDRVLGLKTGADEYLGKPYDRAQVASRAQDLVRRGKSRIREKPLVLVIDDSNTFQQMLKEVLVAAGYDVVLAGTGEEGLRRAADLRPDALIVDGMLPGIEGLDVIRNVRLDSALRRTPCLLLTASTDRSEELRALEAGVDRFVFKGEDMDVILAKLRILVRPERTMLKDEDPSLSGPKRVLAVDDSATFREELAEQLRLEGFDVVPARSGEEALELLSVQKVDAILLDVVMPGLSGQETCRRIKSNPACRDIPLLMLTALEERDALLEGINAGADDYITKSDRFEVLKARLKAQLRRCQFEEENRRFREHLVKEEMEALEMGAVKQLSETRAKHIEDLEKKNEELRRAKDEADALAKELESFSYSVSHDLRAPLRSISGFSKMLLENYPADSNREEKRLLGLVQASTEKMGELIDDMLGLAKVTQRDLNPELLDMSAMAWESIEALRGIDPGRSVEIVVRQGLTAWGDRGLIRILLENLFANAWKFTAKTPRAYIHFDGELEKEGRTVFQVRDNGAGFNMDYADRLFRVFQRLHHTGDFTGTGVGLATVDRVIKRHGGKAWANGKEGSGATFFFSLLSSAPTGHGIPELSV